MKSFLLSCLALASISLSAQAHEIWIERDGSGPVRIFFGEPAQETLDHGQDEIKRVVKPSVFGTAGKAGALTRGNDFLAAPLAGAGDAWLSDDSVFEPWKGEAGGFETVSYYARAGRSTPAAKLDLELVPTTANGSTLTVLYRNKPLPKAEVTVIDPQKWQKTLTSDDKGRVTLPALRAGRHILVVNNKEPVTREIAGKQVSMVHHISTLTFVAE
ncbi:MULTISPECIES: DUF4198 domain-containing protein [Xanthomonas]|uniref:DUF4198 domain-containing protein n=1 Tax=Xanthomonas vesicatoria TaxID=56460 RepID=A0AAJ0J0B7_9XANT|nr:MULTISPECIES: DUF4198 domain-containing protein [Xanthomonas]APO96053.1 hypothetical protein BI313_16965 [Xanthomonas vesicatoria]KHM92677.1 hypothetical protein OR60_16015 [Xanthomonas vesicatoria]KHM96830.1 hypothetical protein OR61_05240 [Xanthomonas vesicatoria]KTF38008.1 hypothetical protein LMG919_05000 [Xanthomonas vesicatoria]MCC8557363.1 DUF4198 domain-containing protein [Xanthomonas vesicatoria]